LPWVRAALAVGVAVSVAVGCGAEADRSPRMAGMPPLMLWAWERPEDLSYIAPETTGVAFLASTVRLEGDDTVRRPRLQPLAFPPGAALMAVVRVEAPRSGGARLSADQRGRVVDEATRVAALRGVLGVQVDFDARVSERDFYRLLLEDIRAALPPDMPLSVTALASWAMDDNWMVGLPVDEIVPMLFQMGSGGEAVAAYVERHGRLRSHPPDGAVGYATDEARPPMRAPGRIYIFCPAGWTERVYKTMTEEYLP